MRLVDADKTVRQLELEAYIHEQSESHGYRYAQELIENQPTVEAIPIERLRDRASKMLDFGEGVERIIKEWLNEQ